MSNKLLNLILFLFISVLSSFSQVNIKADNGCFEKFAPWGDGFLGVVETQTIAVIPKYRKFQYFDKSGKLIWDTKVDPYNFSGGSIWNEESNYSYYLNFPFDKVALTGKTSKEDFLNIYRLDNKGKLESKTIKFTDKLSSLNEKISELTVSYYCATKNHLLVVIQKGDSKFYIIKIDEDFSYDVSEFDIKWDKNLYNKVQLGLPKFYTNNNEFFCIQPSLLNSTIKFDVQSIDFENFSEINKSEFNVNFEGYNLSSKNQLIEANNTFDNTLLSYSIVTSKGNTTYYSPSLSQYFNIKFDQKGEMYILSYYSNEINKTVNDGYLVFKKSNQDEDLDPILDLKFKNIEKFKSENHLYFNNENDYILGFQVDKKTSSVLSSTGKTKTYNTINIVEMMNNYLLKDKFSLDEEINNVFINNNSIRGFKYSGKPNALYHFGKVIVY